MDIAQYRPRQQGLHSVNGANYSTYTLPCNSTEVVFSYKYNNTVSDKVLLKGKAVAF